MRATLLRRLHFEAYTLTASDLRARVESRGDDGPRKMPREERQSRLNSLRRRLPGLDLTEHHHPAHHMVDVFSQMQEEGQLRHLPWQEYASRQDEAKGVKRVKEWKPTASGTLQEVVSTSATLVNIGGDNLKLLQAFVRRGVAMEVANLMTFERHEELVKYYLREMTREPPPQYASVSYDQVLRTDVEVFRYFADRTTDGLDMAPDGSRPLDNLVAGALTDSTIRMLMLPLSTSSSSVARPTKPAGGRDPPFNPTSKNQLKKARLRERMKNLANAQPPPPPDGGKKGGKGAGKGKGARTPMKLPDGLAGTTSLPDGSPICFKYQFGTCPFQTQKQCKFGVHACCQCYAEHPFIKCS